MRINSDFDEQVSREFLARRASMASELGARPARTPAGIRAVPPAAQVAGDEVHISPEARAAVWAPPGGPAQPLRSFPSPTEVIAVLRALAELPPGAVPEAGLKDLGRLLGQLARGLPGQAPPVASEQPAALADAVVRILLGDRPGMLAAPTADIDAPAALQALRDLLATAAGASTGPVTTFERATAALLLAVLRWRGPLAGLPLPDAVSTPAEGFPPALLSLVGQQGRPLRPRRRTRDDDPERAPDDEEETEDELEEPPLPYRSSPRRT